MQAFFIRCWRYFLRIGERLAKECSLRSATGSRDGIARQLEIFTSVTQAMWYSFHTQRWRLRSENLFPTHRNRNGVNISLTEGRHSPSSLEERNTGVNFGPRQEGKDTLSRVESTKFHCEPSSALLPDISPWESRLRNLIFEATRANKALFQWGYDRTDRALFPWDYDRTSKALFPWRYGRTNKALSQPVFEIFSQLRRNRYDVNASEVSESPPKSLAGQPERRLPVPIKFWQRKGRN